MPIPNGVSIAKVEMLIKKNVEEVYEAFIDPTITTKFWFTKSSGKLERGKRIRWEWEMYGVSADLEVIEMEQNKRILIQFDDDTSVEWVFTARATEETIVTITNVGFKGDSNEIINQVIDATGGFTIVLCGLKALLEHNIILNLVSDRFPDAHVQDSNMNKANFSRKDRAISFLQLVAAGEVEEAYKKHIDPGFRHHNPYFRGDANSLKSVMKENAAENPNKILEVKHAIEEGDLVTVHSHVKQNPRDLGGAVVHIFRFLDNQIVELWDIGQPVPENSPNENGMF